MQEIGQDITRIPERAEGGPLSPLRSLSAYGTDTGNRSARQQISLTSVILHRLSLGALGVLLSVALAPAGAIAGDLTVTPSIRVDETYTNNVDLEPDDEAESALVTEVTPGLRVRSRSSRATTALDAFPTIRHQTAGDDKGINFDANLTGLGNVELLKDLFFVDGSASISQQVLNSRETATAANQRTVQVYRLSPSLRKRFGSLVNAELRYLLGQVFVDADQATTITRVSDSTTHAGAFNLSSGPDFDRLSWALSTTASKSNLTDDDDVTRTDVDLLNQYAVTRYLTLIAAVGYQTFDDGNPANEIDSPTWRAGVGLRPGPRTQLEFTYGERDDELSPVAKFRYDISSQTRVTASYSETLQQPQERLLENLSFARLEGETDTFIDERTGAEFNPNPSPFDIRDETTRVRSLRVALDGTQGRNTFAIVGSVEHEEEVPSGDEQDVIRVGGRWSRQLSPRLGTDVYVAYENTEFDTGQTDDEVNVFAGLRYDLASNVTATLLYGFRKQISTNVASEYTEHAFTAGLRVSF